MSHRHLRCMRDWRCLRFLYAVASLLVVSAAADGQEMALLGIVADAATEVPAALFTAELSKRTGVQLLERAEIDRVRREQALSAGNGDYIKLGEILGADGLLLLEIPGGSDGGQLTARLVAVRTGIILANFRFDWPIADPAEWSKGLANHLQPLLPKLTVPRANALPISVMNLRAAIASADSSELEKHVTLLLIERLSREQRVFVLERRRLDLLQSEQDLNRRDETSFWQGSYLLDGSIDPESYSPEQLTIRVRLRPPGADTALPVEVTGSRTNLADLIERLARKTLETLAVRKLGPPWNAVEESQQFVDEARWAFRWRAFEQAQAACESAWSLGLHGKELAILRTRSYIDSLLPPQPEQTSPCSLETPEIPDVSRLPQAIRGFEVLFCEADAVARDQKFADPEWFDLGLRCVRYGAMYLESFYYAAEMRVGHEEELANLRGLIRRTVVELRRFAPPIRAPVRPIYWATADHVQACGTLEWLIWQEGGIWHEQPEDSVPMLKNLLAAGYTPVHLPRIIGWNWSDRRRSPSVLRTFVADLCASDNPQLRLEGKFLALARDPETVEGARQSGTRALFDEAWEQRHWLFANPQSLAVLANVVGHFSRKDSHRADPYEIFKNPDLAAVVQHLRQEYLRTEQTNINTFRLLFPEKRDAYPAAQAAELLPDLEAFQQRAKLDVSVSYVLNQTVNLARQLSGTNVVHVANLPSTPLRAAEELVSLEFIRWKSGNRPVAAYVADMRIHNGRIWGQISLRDDASPDTGRNKRAFVQVDARTGEALQIPFPPHTEDVFYPTFGIAEDALYACFERQLMRYLLREHRWETIPVALDGTASITEAGGRLYLATGTSLLELAPQRGEAQILVSSRRRPALNELDGLWTSGAALYASTDGMLDVQITNRVFRFDPIRRDWSARATFPNARPLETFMFPQPTGLLWLQAGFATPRQMVAFWNSRQTPELLIEQQNPRRRGNTNSVASFGTARWHWPEPFRLDFPCYASDGQSLFLLHPRILPWGLGRNPDSEPIRFQDDRHATLLCFAPGRSDSAQVPLIFRRDGQPWNPFQQTQVLWGAQRLLGLFFLAAEQHLIVADPSAAGHWLLPQTDTRALAKTVSNREAQEIPARP